MLPFATSGVGVRFPKTRNMVDCISWLLIPSGCDTSRSLLISVLLAGGELEHHWGKEGPGGKPVRWERNLKLLSLVD